MEVNRKAMPVISREKWGTKEEYLEYLRRLDAYVLLAEPFASKKEVLEIGCGTGYGANYLSKSVSSLVATDISNGGISYCQDKYVKDNLTFMTADGLNLPFEHETFDVVVSFQVIEHIEPKKVTQYLSEVKRVLKPGGIFVLSTPNSRLRLLPFQKPWNQEHKKEYNDRELKKLLKSVFEEVKVCGLCGSDEIQAIERRRVKQTPFKVYAIIPAYRLLNRFLPPFLLSKLTQTAKVILKFGKRQNLTPQETFIDKFSIHDFIVDPSCPEYCLDLYAICTKFKP